MLIRRMKRADGCSRCTYKGKNDYYDCPQIKNGQTCRQIVVVDKEKLCSREHMSS